VKTAVAYFKIMSSYRPGEFEEDQEKPQSAWLVAPPKFEPGTSV